MQVKFSEDVIPLSDLKINPGKVVSRAQDTHRPFRNLVKRDNTAIYFFNLLKS